jgi:predicted RNA-binding protein with RPS1 domain/bifunctional DNA-binding transcriptional regulator/antitoxin component of YhaV-PrlF toxin-antitoxin module
MPALRFKLPIGAKRQVTIPRRCMEQLSLEVGGELLLEIVGDHAVLLPMVSVPRRDLPDEIRQKFEARRGQKSTDIPLDEFLGEMGYGEAAHAGAQNTGEVPSNRVALGGEEASELVPAVYPSPEVGRVFLGRIVKLEYFGAFVELYPGIRGLVHISEIADHDVMDIRDEFRLGDQILVKVISVEGDRIHLSRKVLIEEQQEERSQRVAESAEIRAVQESCNAAQIEAAEM